LFRLSPEKTLNPKRQRVNLLETIWEIILENPSGIRLQEIYREIERRYPLTERQKARNPKYGHVNFQHLTRYYIQPLVASGEVIRISRGKYGPNLGKSEARTRKRVTRRSRNHEMVQEAYLIVHNKDAFERHPNMLGLTVRIDKSGNVKPLSPLTDKIRQRVTVVYYTSGDYMVEGIFEVASDRLDEGDERRVKEWTSDIQFIIKPKLKPVEGVDFRNLILKLNLFKGLKKPEKDYRMALRGPNYIRFLDSHDFHVIEKALQSSDNHRKRRILTRKYGSGGEGEEHKMLKERVANNPNIIGLTNVQEAEIEHSFISGDSADILFRINHDHYVVVEIETDFPRPGCYQALKYKVLQSAEIGANINSSNVQAVLVAKTLPLEVQDICSKYSIRTVLIRS